MPALRLAGALGSLHTLQTVLEMEQAHEIRCNLHFGDEKCMLVLKTLGTHYQVVFQKAKLVHTPMGSK